MSKKLARVVLLLVVLGLLVAGAGWNTARTELHATRFAELGSLSALLNENRDLLNQLQAGSPGAGILTAYLAAIRADGVAEYADAKQRLDRLAENNAGILALINVYKPHAKTAAFAAQAEKFQRYAIAWRDRWNSAMELFMAGGNYPVAEVPFPAEFLAAVQAEIDATS